MAEKSETAKPESKPEEVKRERAEAETAEKKMDATAEKKAVRLNKEVKEKLDQSNARFYYWFKQTIVELKKIAEAVKKANQDNESHLLSAEQVQKLDGALEKLESAEKKDEKESHARKEEVMLINVHAAFAEILQQFENLKRTDKTRWMSFIYRCLNIDSVRLKYLNEKLVPDLLQIFKHQEEAGFLINHMGRETDKLLGWKREAGVDMAALQAKIDQHIDEAETIAQYLRLANILLDFVNEKGIKLGENVKTGKDSLLVQTRKDLIDQLKKEEKKLKKAEEYHGFLLNEITKKINKERFESYKAKIPELMRAYESYDKESHSIIRAMENVLDEIIRLLASHHTPALFEEAIKKEKKPKLEHLLLYLLLAEEVFGEKKPGDVEVELDEAEKKEAAAHPGKIDDKRIAEIEKGIDEYLKELKKKEKDNPGGQQESLLWHTKKEKEGLVHLLAQLEKIKHLYSDSPYKDKMLTAINVFELMIDLWDEQKGNKDRIEAELKSRGVVLLEHFVRYLVFTERLLEMHGIGTSPPPERSSKDPPMPPPASAPPKS